MRVLITGHRGLLGSACVRVFSQKYDVLTSEGVDLTDTEAAYWLFHNLHPDIVIHCAAKVGGVKANRSYPVDFIEDNIAISSNVIVACHLFGVKKLVNIGSSCMFPKNAPIPVKEDSFMTGPLEPDVEAYAAAKILIYELCNAYRRQYGSNFVTVAPGNLYGPNDNYGESAHVIPALIHRAHLAKQAGEPLKAWGDGSAIREFLHADDAANAIMLVAEQWDSPELIAIGSGVGTSIRDLANAIAKIVNVKGVEWQPGEPVGIQEKTFDVTRLKSLGWHPKISLAEGLWNTYEDYLANKNIRFK